MPHRPSPNCGPHPTRSFHKRPNRRRQPPKPTPNRPIRLTGLPSIPHLNPLNLSQHRHNNLPNKRQRLSPRMLRPPPETTADMCGNDGRRRSPIRPDMAWN
jgi:hypothetical protein